MVAADETILLTKQSGKHCRRRKAFVHGVAVRSAEFEKSVDGVYPGCAGMGGYSLQRQPRTADQKFGISKRLFIDHYSFGHRFVPRGENWFLLPDMPILRHRDLGSCLDIERSADAHGSTRLATDATGKVVQDMNYGAFGNALGFNAATALTTYLYSSMPFDAASGNYYDHARYFDTGTGSFTQADYGYSGSLANPMTDLSYMFTGGDPINLSDLNGHGFDLGSVIFTVSFQVSMFAAEYAPAIATVTQAAGAIFIASSIYEALATANFVPQNNYVPYVQAISAAVFTAGESLVAFQQETQGILAPLSGSSDGRLFSGAEANRLAIEADGRLAGTPPYAADSLAAEGNISADVRLVRVYNPVAAPFSGRMQGGWAVPYSEVEGLTPEQIQEKLALPYRPTAYVNVGAVGFSARVGTAGENFGAGGGGIQVQIQDWTAASFTDPTAIDGVLK